MPEERSRVLTLVFTDLADSTALKTQRGDQAVRDLIRRHREHVTRLSGDSSGRIIDWAGDGCFLTFETSSAAVMFALRLQQAHANESDLPGVRIGIHMGEITESPGPDGEADHPRIEGLAVDLAARISGLAKPGQVLMSSAVYNSTRQRLGVEAFGQPIIWQAHGTYELKGFDEPLVIGEAGIEGIAPLEAPKASDKAKLIKRAKRRKGDGPSSKPRERRPAPIWALGAIALLIAGLAYVVGTRRSEPLDEEAAAPAGADAIGPITSLAVLPLDNLMNDPAQDYFADGMTEAITAELAKIKSLKVISRTSVMQYKDTTKTMPEIAAELGVDGLIEGSVLRVGDEVRITAQLIHGPSDSHLWSKTYDGTVENVLQLHSDVALEIAREINATLTPDEQQRVTRTHEVDPEAYENYLLGEHFRNERTEEGFDEAIQYFEKATEIDPNFAEAWVGLARSYSALGGWSISPPREASPKARSAAMRALELDPELSTAHMALGWVSHAYDWEWEEAERRYRRGIELNPNDAEGHIYLAWLLVQLGRSEEALRETQTALDLDPKYDQTRSEAAAVFGVTGQWQKGLGLLEEVIQRDPDHVGALDILTFAHLELGNFDEAIAFGRRWVENAGEQTFPRLRMAWIYSQAGRDEEARAILAQLRAESGERYTSFTGLGWVHLGLGEIDEAFEAFDKGFENSDWFTTWMRIFPTWPARASSELVDDPRYWNLIERMGYPPLPRDHPGYEAEQAWLQRKAAAEEASAPIRKIAVLPFENMSSDPEQEFFVDGMTEALISELAKIKSLRVISRTSVMRYKDTDKSLTEIARELGVDAIVEGSVLKAGDSVRITAQLIHGLTDEHLWSASRTAPLENILQLQAEVALSMTDEINTTVTPEERTRIASAKPVNPEAYEYYVQGQHFLSRRNPEGFATARRQFENALELDPDFALARTGLSDTFSLLVAYGLMRAHEGMPRAREEALKALEVDPNLGAAHSSLGSVLDVYDWKWAEAEAALKRGIELSPGHAPAYHWYAVYLNAQGRADEALAMERQAFDLDPVSPIIGAWMTILLLDAGREDEALENLENLLLMYPDLPRVRQVEFNTYFKLDRYEEALKAIETYEERYWNPEFTLDRKIHSLVRLGRETEARRVLQESIDNIETVKVTPWQIAVSYMAFDDMDRAMEWLEKGYDNHDPEMFRLAVIHDEGWISDASYADPRFQDLLKRMNFPERPDGGR